MGDVLDLLYNFINDKPAPDVKHLSRMAIERIEHLQQQIKELKKAQDLTRREQFAMAIERIEHLQQQIKELKKAQDLTKREQFAMAALHGILSDLKL